MVVCFFRPSFLRPPNSEVGRRESLQTQGVDCDRGISLSQNFMKSPGISTSNFSMIEVCHTFAACLTRRNSLQQPVVLGMVGLEQHV